jgi:hypothetical protein
MMAKRISECDRALKELRQDLRVVIRYKYEIGGKEMEKRALYVRDTGLSESTFGRRLQRAHKAVADYIWKHG